MLDFINFYKKLKRIIPYSYKYFVFSSFNNHKNSNLKNLIKYYLY